MRREPNSFLVTHPPKQLNSSAISVKGFDSLTWLPVAVSEVVKRPRHGYKTSRP